MIHHLTPHQLTATQVLSVLGWIGFGCFLLYFIRYEPPYLWYVNQPIPITNAPVKVGTAPELKVSRCNTDDIVHVYGAIHKIVNDDNRGQPNIDLPSSEASVETGCHTITRVLGAVIPLSTPPGHYHIEGHAETRGMLKTNLVRWESMTFEVVP